MSKSSTISKIDALLQKAISEAVEDGVDIDSQGFRKSLEELKRRLAEYYGISLQEYKEAKQFTEKQTEANKSRIDEVDSKSLESFKKLEKAIDDFSSQVEKLKEDTDEKVNSTEQKALSSIEELKKLLNETQRLFEERLEGKLTSKADKEDVFRKDEEIRELADKIEGDRTELKSELNELADDIKQKIGKKVAKKIKVKKEFSKNDKRKLKELMAKDWFNEIQEQIHDLTPRLWQGMAMGLKKSIRKNSVDNLVFNETLSGTVDGSNKDFTLSNSPKSGTLVLKDENGVVLDKDNGDYSISGKTITLAYAPISKAPIAILYKK